MRLNCFSLLMPTLLNAQLKFPDPRDSNAEGLVAIGGDLSVPRLLLAYRSGVFPWTVHPISWWSPDPRAIIELDHFEPPRSLSRLMRNEQFKVTVDEAFQRVMEECAAPAAGRPETWITSEFIEAYTRLHAKGFAHSVECWRGNKLVGGIYGVSIGGFFAGESMFHRVSNASKVALCHLVNHLRQRKFQLFDIQMITPVTRQLGALEISRADYLKRVRAATESGSSFA